MMIFTERQVDEAIEHAERGGQALHLFASVLPSAPACFRRSVQRAHLIDQNRERLARTARRLGVRRIVIGRDGTPGQHIDLCGKPLKRALAEAGSPS